MENPNRFRHGRAICAYCGTSPAPEVEHVVARSFFGDRRDKAKSLPSDLIIVAACRKCNHGERSSLNADEDYARSVMIAGEHAIHHEAALSVLNGSFERAIARNQGEAPKVLRTSRIVEMVTASGIWTGYTTILAPEWRRVSRVFEKVVRGLHFHETGMVVPPTYQVKVRFFLEEDGTPKIEQFMAMANVVAAEPGFRRIGAKNLGDHVFTYWAALNPSGLTGIWFTGFYNGAFPAVVSVLPDRSSIALKGDSN